MIGKTISHYRILEKLGEGGMGIVYKAEDTKLKRTVALKFLPSELTRDPEAKKRFIHEAQAASGIDHPNICTIYEINETEDGQLFIAMACYEGQTLKDMVGAYGHMPLQIAKVIDIAIQVARGLQKAHEKGIVHRDIKPANIMITSDGEVKILDFGLAKLRGQIRLTKEGTTVGTVAYMSPEQARGEEVDHRSDIWSLGVVLYEMLTGQLPFKGEYEQALIYSILSEEPKFETALPPGSPMEIERIVKKTLAKKPSERYQHTVDLIVDLEKAARGPLTGATASGGLFRTGASRRTLTLWITAASVIITAVTILSYVSFWDKRATKEPAVSIAARETALQEAAPAWRDSIAVLPFKDFSPQKDQEYFCDGMTDDIITKLSNVHDLKVISRTSAMRYKNTDKSIREIGKELGVSSVLEGSIQKESDRVRINAQLIRTSDDAHLWAEKYDRKLESVFDIQDEISMAIVDALEMKLTLKERRGIAERPIDNVAAYQCYLKANAEIWRFSESSVDSARIYLQKGLDILGDNAFLHSAMALVYCQYVNIGVAQEDYIAKAEEYARKALSLDPDSPQAHHVMGIINLWFYGNLREGISQLKRALAVSPNDPEAMRILAVYYIVSVGNPAAAVPLVRRFKHVDPLHPWNYSLEGLLYEMDGRYDLSLEQYRQWYQSDPDNPHARFNYAFALSYEKELDEAFEVIDRGARATPDNVSTKFGLLLKYGLLKEKEIALREITPDFEKTCRRDHQWSYFVALGLALADAKEESMDWLENAVNKGFINYPLIQREPYLDNLRGEERFRKLMERVKYEWEHFEVPE